MKMSDDFFINVEIECPRDHEKLRPVVKVLKRTMWRIGRIFGVRYGIYQYAGRWKNEEKK